MPFNKKKILKLARGYWGRSKNCNRLARQRVQKALLHQYMDRRKKIRDRRTLWIIQINAAAREYGIAYSKFINGLKRENIWLNRRMLSELARNEPFSFKALIDQVKFMKGLTRRSPYDDGQHEQANEDYEEEYAEAAREARLELES
eukprot:TRINITY_DN977_c0_g1_i3.p3 TRINITY_DN977_c0_g1~~TRINITY_DN977_c0_g1_i3.p3  ORF type:complete len:146 (-),score=15.08 TRINITY_DN977_c0_g1_i3:231-668(-)